MITQDDLKKLIREDCSKIVSEQLYPEKITDKINQILSNLALVDVCDLKAEIDSLVKQKVFKNKEKFYVEFYNNVVTKSGVFFPQLCYPSGTVLCRKLGESIFWHFSKSLEDIENSINTKSLNEKEYYALQYLAGYVTHKLYLSHRNNKNYRSKICQDSMSILSATKSKTLPENAKLINALLRGGLWAVNFYTEKIFIIAEKYFNIHTGISSREIMVYDMVKTIMEFSYIKEFYKNIVDTCDGIISLETTKVVLYDMLTVYLKVRSFSLAKDVVQKHKISQNAKGKAKSLRKTLKKSTTEEDKK